MSQSDEDTSSTGSANSPLQGTKSIFSSKSKGKAKLVDITPATFIVKFSEDIPDLTLRIRDVFMINISTLRQKIRQSVGERLANRRLRLIHAGKVLNDKTDIASEVANDASQDKIYIHCSVGDVLTADELAKESEYDSRVPTRSTLPELRGFDRLRATGFTDDDINQLRQQFSSIYGGATANSNRETMARMEEQWIDTGAGEMVDNTSLLGGDYLDDLIGVLIGMFLGVLVIFIKDSNLLSDRQRHMMLFGFIVNISFALLRFLI
ncbi:DSC E3 ubiquitin ligase complex subunit 3 [Trichomonascus vanleenenianus]|uniref:Dsc3p n=1 Tax=Trichomonascus vanleenenianus TaxID=2268995 RepID=UPI003ECAC35E